MIQPSGLGSLTGPCQVGICLARRVRAPSARGKVHVTLSVFSSSIGTRHSKWSPVNSAFGHKHTRPTVHNGSFSLMPSVTAGR